MSSCNLRLCISPRSYLCRSPSVVWTRPGYLVERLHSRRSPKCCSEIQDLETVASIQPDPILRPLLDTVGPTCGADIAAQQNVTGSGKTVAIVDTGIDGTHPGFTGRISPTSRDFTSTGGAGALHDLDGHGTHVAGIVGGDGSGSILGAHRGIAPGADLMVLKAIGGTGQQYGSVLAQAISHAVLSGANVINLSVGESPWDPPRRAISAPWVWSSSENFP